MASESSRSPARPPKMNPAFTVTPPRVRSREAAEAVRAVEVGELLICFGRVSALLDRQATAVDTMADLLGDLGVSVPAETAEDA